MNCISRYLRGRVALPICAVLIAVGLTTSNGYTETPASSVPSFTQHALPSDKLELYHRLAEEISKSVSYGAGPPIGSYHRFKDAIAFGSAHCGYYSDELLQRLARQGIQADLVEGKGPGDLVVHVLVSLPDAVIDPTFGIVYPHPLSQLLDDPTLANSFIGEKPPEVSRGYVGETFFSTVQTITYWPLPEEANIQRKAKISIKKGYASPLAASYWIDGDIKTPAAAYWNAAGTPPQPDTDEDFVMALAWNEPIFARSVTIVPGWLDGATPRQVKVRVYSNGKLAYTAQRDTLRLSGGSYSVTIPNDIKIDKIKIAFNAKDKEPDALVLRQVIVDGWPAAND